MRGNAGPSRGTFPSLAAFNVNKMARRARGFPACHHDAPILALVVRVVGNFAEESGRVSRCQGRHLDFLMG